MVNAMLIGNKKPLSNFPAEASQPKGAVLLRILGRLAHYVNTSFIVPSEQGYANVGAGGTVPISTKIASDLYIQSKGSTV